MRKKPFRRASITSPSISILSSLLLCWVEIGGSWARYPQEKVPAATLKARTAWCRPVRFRFSYLLRVFRAADLEHQIKESNNHMKSFRQLGVADAVVEALSRRGVESPFAIQTLVIPDGLNGQDLLAKSPTGSGKTLAFAIPIVQRIDPKGSRPTALVLVPTRELALQVADEFASIGPARGVKVAAVYGGTPVVAQGKRAKDAHVLVATPGRL